MITLIVCAKTRTGISEATIKHVSLRRYHFRRSPSPPQPDVADMLNRRFADPSTRLSEHNTYDHASYDGVKRYRFRRPTVCSQCGGRVAQWMTGAYCVECDWAVCTA